MAVATLPKTAVRRAAKVIFGSTDIEAAIRQAESFALTFDDLEDQRHHIELVIRAVSQLSMGTALEKPYDEWLLGLAFANIGAHVNWFVEHGFPHPVSTFLALCGTVAFHPDVCNAACESSLVLVHTILSGEDVPQNELRTLVWRISAWHIRTSSAISAIEHLVPIAAAIAVRSKCLESFDRLLENSRAVRDLGARRLLAEDVVDSMQHLLHFLDRYGTSSATRAATVEKAIRNALARLHRAGL